MRRNILKYLKELYPNEEWSWERDFGHCRYYTKSGWHARWCSRLAPKYDGDDESCVSEFWVNFNDGRYEQQLYFVKEIDTHQFLKL